MCAFLIAYDQATMFFWKKELPFILFLFAFLFFPNRIKLGWQIYTDAARN